MILDGISYPSQEICHEAAINFLPEGEETLSCVRDCLDGLSLGCPRFAVFQG